MLKRRNQSSLPQIGIGLHTMMILRIIANSHNQYHNNEKQRLTDQPNKPSRQDTLVTAIFLKTFLVLAAHLTSSDPNKVTAILDNPAAPSILVKVTGATRPQAPKPDRSHIPQQVQAMSPPESAVTCPKDTIIFNSTEVTEPPGPRCQDLSSQTNRMNHSTRGGTCSM